MVDITNKKITVLGAARSGIAVAELLQKLKANVFVSDIAHEKNKQKEQNKLKGLGIPFEFGKHSDHILQSDLIVISPGIPVASAIVQKILSRKIPIYSEIEVASWYCKSPIIAITGSNGKTTTTTLIGEMLKMEQPNRIQAGNIGDPFSAQVLDSLQEAWAAIEVSSFQLETIDSFHPKIAVLLNLAPNHLDRYDHDYEKYINAKMRVCKNLTEDDYIIFNLDDKLLTQKIEKFKVHKFSFSTSSQTDIFLKDNTLFLQGKELINVNNIKLNGIHNYMNCMAAALAANLAEISEKSIIKVLTKFRGVEHRLEFVRELDGITYINDSKATTVESLAVALQSFEDPIILIAGGKDKGSDFSKLNSLIERYTREVILIGDAQKKIANNWSVIKQMHFAKTLKEAVIMARKLAKQKDTVLLSPACASFDMFNDYEHRGRQFKKIVNELV